MTTKLKTVLKYAVALVLLAYVMQHAGMDKVAQYFHRMSTTSVLLAFLLAGVAQPISAMRMRFFFQGSGFPINPRFALVLFYVGGFYNYLLPGGIGGDAYKVILARRRMELPAMQGVRIMLADRASGLCIVMLIVFFALSQFDLSQLVPHQKALLISAAVVTLVSYVFFCRWLLKQSAAVMLGSLPYSFIIQALWIGALVTMLNATGGGHAMSYVVLYCAASVAAMLPISPGGLGVKEMTYMYGAGLIQHYTGDAVNPDLGIALSLCLFVIGFITSLPGLLWLEKVGSAEFAVVKP